jgi:predicted MFS family arabinose efflux permease
VPTVSPEHGGASRGTAPDARRYGLLLVATALGVTGAMGSFTYITPYLLSVGGFVPAALSLLLLGQGTAGVIGTLTVGHFLDRHPWGALVTLFVMLSVGLLGLFAFGTVKAAAIVLLGLCGMSFSALTATIGHRTMLVAPAGTDIASAGTSSAFNLGIAAGSLLGSLLVANVGIRIVPLFGGLLALAALAIVLNEPRLVRARVMTIAVPNAVEPVPVGSDQQPLCAPA